MKIIITESQYKKLMEEEQEVLNIPSLKYFDNDWNQLQKFLESEGNPPYSIDGNLDLRRTPIKSLGNLTSVGGYLDLRRTLIKSLGNLISVGGYLDLYGTSIKSLGNLTSVGSYLDLANASIKSLGNLTSVGDFLDLSHSSIKSLGNLQTVEGDLYLQDTPMSKKYSEEEIKQMVNVGGGIRK